MRPIPLLFAGLVLALLVGGGCASTSNKPEATAPAAQGKSAKTAVRGPYAYVFIDGKQQGVTPATVRVRRGFGEKEVSLEVGGKEVRKFVLEQAYTSDTSDLVFSYWGDEAGATRSFDVSLLPTENDTLYVIPYFQEPITIEDRKYSLTLLVSN